MSRHKDFSDLVGKTLLDIRNSGDEIFFETDDGTTYKMYHEQDCCEHVRVEEIIGDLQDLIETPILRAEVRSDGKVPDKNGDGTETWTFYEIATIKGSVTIRWYGSSNGYYSESVNFEEA